MKTEIYLKSKHDDSFDAKAVYIDGHVIVKSGSIIRTSFATYVRGGRAAKKAREDRSIVSAEGIVLKDCTFNSPSTSAQFVMGSSVNGWTAWHVSEKENLKQYLEKQTVSERYAKFQDVLEKIK